MKLDNRARSRMIPISDYDLCSFVYYNMMFDILNTILRIIHITDEIVVERMRHVGDLKWKSLGDRTKNP